MANIPTLSYDAIIVGGGGAGMRPFTYGIRPRRHYLRDCLR